MAGVHDQGRFVLPGQPSGGAFVRTYVIDGVQFPVPAIIETVDADIRPPPGRRSDYRDLPGPQGSEDPEVPLQQRNAVNRPAGAGRQGFRIREQDYAESGVMVGSPRPRKRRRAIRSSSSNPRRPSTPR